MPAVIVSKLNPQGQETWRYKGQLIEREDSRLVVEAYFDREDMQFHGMLLAKGDRFVETYYTDRWYNIFEIHDREDDRLRGWYCNISSPAKIEENLLSYVDLALDLLVFPDGRQIVLDEDEFADLEISPGLRAKAEAALLELQEQFKAKVSHTW